MLKKKAIEYFNAFCRSDMASLRGLLSDNVCLHDWILDVSGIESVINETLKIISALRGISVEVVNLFEVDSTVIAELIIGAENFEPIKVVDVMSFDCDGKICSIRAYKG